MLRKYDSRKKSNEGKIKKAMFLVHLIKNVPSLDIVINQPSSKE